MTVTRCGQRVPSRDMPTGTSIPHKLGIDNDAQRAQQAIFMAVYHWGVHGLSSKWRRVGL